MKQGPTIAFTGGGSGGHILPILSLMESIDTEQKYRSQLHHVYRFGEKKGMEYRFFTQHQDSFQHIKPQFITILAGKYRRETIRISRWRNFRDLFLFPLGIIQSIWHILTKRISVVFVKGGYVSLPVVIAARLCRRRIYVHDSDTTPGLTTRLASRFASQNFSGFPGTLRNTIPIGQILSDNLVASPEESRSLPDDKYIVLVAGGSLGSRKLYQAVLDAIRLDAKQFQDYYFVFINGQHLVQTSLDNVLITGLIQDQAQMGSLYRRADFAIVRGGTTTLAEAKLFELPLAIVPLPITHDQYKNAQFYVDHFQDILIDQHDDDFIQQLYTTLENIVGKTISLSDEKIKTKIHKAKTTILDSMFQYSSPDTKTKHKFGAVVK